MNRRLVAAAVAALVLVPLGYFWQQSLQPDSFSATDMGRPDFGGGPVFGHTHHGGTSVTDLVADPQRPADVKVDLTASMDSGRFTLNGTSPGPVIRATQGQLVQVKLTNDDIEDGVSLHWHGIDVPNAEDGVAGVTQDAVPPGKSFTYRFVADDAGTYWYHSHQVSSDQVARGLFGAVVIETRDPQPDVVALSHTYSSGSSLNGKSADLRVSAPAGTTRRVRVINTDNGTLQVWSGQAFAVAAIDGRDLHQPGGVADRFVRVAAGGRADLIVTSPARVQLGGRAVIVAPEGQKAPVRPRQPPRPLDLMSYGSPAPLPFDVAAPDRSFTYDIGRRPGFLDGVPGLWWTVNGAMGLDVPMYMVRTGDLVKFTIHNGTSEVHPMHLHGHHGVIVSHNGKAAKGSPVWFDSLDVEPDGTYEIVFLADNPGIWMDHCHNLPHAQEGLVAHLMYEGVTTPFLIGGKADNQPE